MGLQIQRPTPVDVTKNNPVEFIYLKGDVDTNGSLRLVPDTSLGTEFEFQLRADDVWNDTGIQIAASTIFLGRDLEVKGAGDWIMTTDVQGELQSLAPHIEFTAAEGTKQSAHIPILSPLNVGFPIQPDFSSEVITSLYVEDNVNPAELLATRTKYKTGSVAATEDVTVSYERPTGTVFWSRNFPASRFTANTDVTIELKGLVEGFTGEVIRTEIKSDAPFSLKSNLAGSAYLLVDFYLLNQEDIITSSTGMDRVLIDFLDGHTIADQSGNLILDGGLVG